MIPKHLLKNKMTIKKKDGSTTNGFINNNQVKIATLMCYLEPSSNLLKSTGDYLKAGLENIKTISHTALFDYIEVDIEANYIAKINDKEYVIELAEPVINPITGRYSHWELMLNEIK